MKGIFTFRRSCDHSPGCTITHQGASIFAPILNAPSGHVSA
nr:MAG TPA_asm: hypothetical protein [Caudoviricetes sp.]